MEKINPKIYVFPSLNPLHKKKKKKKKIPLVLFVSSFILQNPAIFSLSVLSKYIEKSNNDEHPFLSSFLSSRSLFSFLFFLSFSSGNGGSPFWGFLRFHSPTRLRRRWQHQQRHQQQRWPASLLCALQVSFLSSKTFLEI